MFHTFFSSHLDWVSGVAMQSSQLCYFDILYEHRYIYVYSTIIHRLSLPSVYIDVGFFVYLQIIVNRKINY